MIEVSHTSDDGAQKNPDLNGVKLNSQSTESAGQLEPQAIREQKLIDSAEEGLAGLHIHTQARINIYYRSNAYYDSLIPRVVDELEKRFGHKVFAHGFERGSDQQHIRDRFLAANGNLSGALLLCDVTCRESFPGTEISLDRIESRFMPGSLGAYIDKILLENLGSELNHSTNLNVSLALAPVKLRNAVARLEAGHHAVVELLKTAEMHNPEIKDVLICPRHLLDHQPFLEFYYLSLLEYVRLSSEEIQSLEKQPEKSEQLMHQRSMHEMMRQFIDQYSSFPWAELYHSASFPDPVLVELQRVVGTRYNLSFEQPVKLVSDWVQESGIGQGKIALLANKPLAQFAAGELVLDQNTLLIADRHFCNRRELFQAGFQPEGYIALFPLTDFYDSLRIQNLLDRHNLLNIDQVVEELAESLGDAIRREEMIRRSA